MKWPPTPVFLPGETHGRGAWQTSVHGSQRAGHDGARTHASGSEQKVNQIPMFVFKTSCHFFIIVKWKHLYTSISLTFKSKVPKQFWEGKSAVKLQSNTSLPFLPADLYPFPKPHYKPGTGRTELHVGIDWCSQRLSLEASTSIDKHFTAHSWGALLKTYCSMSTPSFTYKVGANE